MKKIIKKTCKYCGKSFLTRDPNMIYCNLGCESDDHPEEPWRTRKSNQPCVKRKICKLCGKEFVPQHKLSEYCSEECKKKQHSIESLNYYAKKKESTVTEAQVTEPIVETPIIEEPIVKSHANSGFSALKIIKSSTRICKFCGKEYHPNAPGQKYCSPVCARNVSVEKLRSKKENKDNTKSFLRKCSQCGLEFRPTGNRQSFCPDCQRERRLEKNRMRYRDKTIKKLKAERVITGTVSAESIQAPHTSADNNLSGYIAELEQKLVHIDTNVQLCEQMIYDNNRERAWLKDHIERLKHITEGEQ